MLCCNDIGTIKYVLKLKWTRLSQDFYLSGIIQMQKLIKNIIGKRLLSYNKMSRCLSNQEVNFNWVILMQNWVEHFPSDEFYRHFSNKRIIRTKSIKCSIKFPGTEYFRSVSVLFACVQDTSTYHPHAARVLIFYYVGN